MPIPLDPDHLKLNEEFPWPDRWPDNLEEAIKFWDDYTNLRYGFEWNLI